MERFMTLPKQCAILMVAIEEELLQPEDIVRWADNIIVSMEEPPMWIIDLATLVSPHMTDFDTCLRAQASAPPPVSRRIQIIVLAHEVGSLSLSDTLSKLFRVTLCQSLGPRIKDPLERQLVDALVHWDQQDDLDVIGPPLQATFTSLFREYSKNASDIIAVLPWKFEKAANRRS